MLDPLFQAVTALRGVEHAPAAKIGYSGTPSIVAVARHRSAEGLPVVTGRQGHCAETGLKRWQAALQDSIAVGWTNSSVSSDPHFEAEDGSKQGRQQGNMAGRFNQAMQLGELSKAILG